MEMYVTWIVAALLIADGLITSVVCISEAGREFIFAAPKDSEFTLQITSVSGDDFSCDRTITEHDDSRDSHKTQIRKTTNDVYTPSTKDEDYFIQARDTMSAHIITVSCQDDVSLKLRSGEAVSVIPPVASLGKRNIALSSEIVIASNEYIELNPAEYMRVKKTINAQNSLWLQISGNKTVNTTEPALVLSGTITGGKTHLFAAPPMDTWGKEYIIDRPGKYKLINAGDNVTSCSTPDGDMKIESGGDNTTEAIDVTVISCEGPILVLQLTSDDKISQAVQSTSQFVNDAVLVSPDVEDNYTIHIMAEKKHINEDFMIDDKPINDLNVEEKEDINDKYVKVKVKVPNGTYRIRHKMPTVRFHPRMTNSSDKEVASAPLSMAPLGLAAAAGVELEANDGVDNDGDFRVDEELLNSIDDDGDGLIDEDTSSNEYYGDNRHKKWPMSYTVVILVILFLLLLVLLAICHYKCKKFRPDVKEPPQENAMVTSYDSRVANTSGYSLSGTWSGFTLSRR